jgi:hypothetical protein
MSAPLDFTTIRAGWETYRADVLPPRAGAVQVMECRRAFYAGAVHLYGALIDNADLPEAEAMARLRAFGEEFEAFGTALGEGKA